MRTWINSLNLYEVSSARLFEIDDIFEYPADSQLVGWNLAKFVQTSF